MSNEFTRDSVLLRNTYYQKLIPITVKVSLEDLEIIEEIKRLRRTNNRSQVIRESIRLYYGLLSNAENIEYGNIIIQNPVVNIVEAKAESKPEINVNVDLGEIVRLVEKLYRYRDTMYPLQRKLVEQLYKKIEKVIVN